MLEADPPRIDTAFLKQYPEFVEFMNPKRKEPDDDEGPDEDDRQTHEERIEEAYQGLREALATELLDTVRSSSPAFFERLVIDLLLNMGYGGTREDAGQAVGRSGDGGIDGIIKEDRLGLDTVDIQAKKWEGTVGRPEIQKFAGALLGQRARRGVSITTSDFSQAARDYPSRIDSTIVLIDSTTLTRLMIDFDIGVTGVSSYELKRVDSDYFIED